MRRCVAFGNRFSKGKLNSLCYTLFTSKRTNDSLTRTEKSDCHCFGVPEQGRFITKEACILRNIPFAAALSRDTTKRALVLYFKLSNSQIYTESFPFFTQYTRRVMNPRS